VKATPWWVPAAPSCSGEWSSNSSALTPMRRSASPSRTSVLRQKLQTALADAAEANSTGAPQFGHAARQARLGARPTTSVCPRRSDQLLQQLGLLGR
jgi:hypothetical protein